MKLLTGIIPAVLLCGICLAQDTTPTQPNVSKPQGQQEEPAAPQATPTQRTGNDMQAAPTRRVAPGSIIPVTLTKSIDAKKVKTGDEVEAKVTQDMKATSGEVVVAKDTRVVGHVTAAQARNKDQKESQVGIAFDHAFMNGGDVSMPMSIQAIVGPQNPSPGENNAGNNSGNDNADRPSSSPSGASGANGRPGGSSSGMPATSSQSNAPPTDNGASTQAATNTRQPITGNTQGVVGISNLKLQMSDNAVPGSVVSSEKNNVKLESGTLMLLKVNP